jgi:hypothetical protein
MDLIDRDSALWEILKPVPDKVVSEITILSLVTPKEAIFVGVDFDGPRAIRI